MASGSTLTRAVLCQYARKKKKKARSEKNGQTKKEPVPLVSFPPIILALVKERRLLGSISERSMRRRSNSRTLICGALSFVPI
jgi:hypothetical protein